MLSTARSAQLGLGAVGVVLISSLAVLGGRAMDRQFSDSAKAPDFMLRDTEGQKYGLGNLQGSISVLAFTSLRCPVSSEYFERIVELANQYIKTGRVQFFLVDTSADNTTSQVINELRVQKQVLGQEFPTLIDRGCQVARQFGVSKTPTIVIVDPQGVVRYRGAFDDSRNPRLVKNQYCRDAVASLLAERRPAKAFTQAFGCELSQPK